MRTALVVAFCLSWLGLLLGPLLSAARADVIVKLVDENGEPVEGAEVGLTAAMGAKLPAGDTKISTEWAYRSHVRSDARGVAELHDPDKRLAVVCVVARHERRQISALAAIDPQVTSAPLEMRLVPEREVRIEARCDEFAKLERPLGPIVVEVESAGKLALSCYPDTSSCTLRLPPGDYQFTVYGGGYPDWSTSTATHHVRRAVHVSADTTPQTIDVVNLPATKLALLEGLPAPELEGIVGWMNGDPTTLHELRGRCVLLDFWGYWCPPCVGRMSKLFALHDQYHDKGLTVVGIHIDLGEGESERVDTAARLDERLAKTRRELWKGRDIPFLVALTSGQRTDFENGADGQAFNVLAAKYGIQSYPTYVLIDRKGNVVKKFALHDENIALLEKMLQEP